MCIGSRMYSVCCNHRHVPGRLGMIRPLPLPPSLPPPPVGVRRMSGVVACILAYVVGGWRNVYGVGSRRVDPEASHNLESSGWITQRLPRLNSSEQIPETNPEGSEWENRKLNERKRVDVWCPNRQELNQSNQKTELYSFCFRVLWSNMLRSTEYVCCRGPRQESIYPKLMKPTIKDYQTILSTMRGCMASFGYGPWVLAQGYFSGVSQLQWSERSADRRYQDTYGVRNTVAETQTYRVSRWSGSTDAMRCERGEHNLDLRWWPWSGITSLK